MNLSDMEEYRAKRDAILKQARQVNAEEFLKRAQEAELKWKQLSTASSLSAPRSYNPNTVNTVGGGASGGGLGQPHAHSVTYSDSRYHSSLDLGVMIKEAVEEASKDFKLTVDAMQEQIDELWEYIREMEDLG